MEPPKPVEPVSRGISQETTRASFLVQLPVGGGEVHVDGQLQKRVTGSTTELYTPPLGDVKYAQTFALWRGGQKVKELRKEFRAGDRVTVDLR